MKILYKHSLYAALSTLLCLFLAQPSQAQRGATGGGGGGRSSGGGSVSSSGGGSTTSSFSRPSASSNTSSFSRPATSSGNTSNFSRPSAGGNFNRPSAGSVGISRPGFNPAPQRQGFVNGQGGVRGNYGYAPRQGTAVRGNYGFAPRQGTVAGGFAPRQGTSVNGLGFTPRGATSGGLTYRTAPRIGYGGYWGNHGYYHYNRGYYGSYYLPSIGFTCGYLPYGYYSFYYGDDQYFFNDGLFYQYYNDTYTVVEPPIGAEIKSLPEKAQSIVINGEQYYELNGVYYRPVTKDDGTIVYEVAGKDGELNTKSTVDDGQPQAPQIGDIVSELPPDCRKIKVNGQKLWVSPDGVYYQELTDSNKNRIYKIVGLPSDETD